MKEKRSRGEMLEIKSSLPLFCLIIFSAFWISSIFVQYKMTVSVVGQK